MEQELTDKLMELNDEFEALYFNDDDLGRAFNSSTYQIEAVFAVEYLAKKEKQIKEFRLRVSLVKENDMTFLNENTIDPTINKLKELTTAFAETPLEER